MSIDKTILNFSSNIGHKKKFVQIFLTFNQYLYYEQIKNNSSLQLESDCSEGEKLEGIVSTLDFGSPDQGKGKFSQGKEEPERFYPEEKSLFSYRDAFFLSITA